MILLKLSLLLIGFNVVNARTVDVRSRIDCYPEPGASEALCLSRKCIWGAASNDDPIGTPWCYYPPDAGYRMDPDGNLYPQFPNPYGDNLMPLVFKEKSYGATLTISIGQQGRYVPPLDLPKNPSSSNVYFKVRKLAIPETNTFAFQVYRSSNNAIVFDTTIGGMLFADKYIQIATRLPSSHLFGIGDHIHHRLKHDLTRYTTWPMLARDIAPDSESALSTQNLYGVHPFYLVVEGDDNAHGVFIINSNAQEITTGPGPHLIYRTIGGQIDIAFFPGPTPEAVIQQYMNFIGTPFLPAYWALGFQLCRWGYKDLDEMKAVVARTQAAGIPLDIPYADIDYMSHDMDFTEGDKWSGFPDYAKQLHQQGLHLILIFDPAVEVDYGSFQRALEQKVSFIEWSKPSLVPENIEDLYPMANGTLIMLGNVWPERNTAFPDFLDPTNITQAWWMSEFVNFHKKLPFDGIWIDMNEPSNFDTDTYSPVGKIRAKARLACPITGPDSDLDNPPYKTQAVYLHDGEQLCSKTLCMLGKTARRTHSFYDTKNLYGWSEAKATASALKAATGKRGAVISRSTFPSSGRFGGHWLGDNTARWSDLQTSIIGAMEFNFFGIPYVGSDICGFIGVTTEELCLRWHQMGAFHPFSRNHNIEGAPAQDPAVWPSVAKAARIALQFRYQYLPFLYSLMASASQNGGTVIRPVFFNFPRDTYAMEVDHQFFWGRALMIAPCVQKGDLSVRVYFPKDTWYSLIPESYGENIPFGLRDIPALWDSLTPVFLRGGHILPRQAPQSTTMASRLNPMELLISTKIDTDNAEGSLYWDNADNIYRNSSADYSEITFYYQITNTGAKINIEAINLSQDVRIPDLQVIEIFGYEYKPDFTSFRVDNKKVPIDIQKSNYDSRKKILYIRALPLATLNKLWMTITWSHTS